MATTSEIQVTEAYIGLLGRAPDKAGLDYWVLQLDAAVAAGDDPTVALKKLMNDIALSSEYTSGTQGSAVPAEGFPSEAQAKIIVQDLYQNLFDRAAKTTFDAAAGQTYANSEEGYWIAELVAGTTTAPEMTIQLITAAKANTTTTTDADVLGYKQEAGTYYVENVSDAQYASDKASAKTAVDDVNGPVSLAASKTATAYLSTGVGESLALTATDGDSLTMTMGSDTVTATAGQMQTNDVLADPSTGDSDSLTISENDGFTFGTVTNVENIAVSLAAQEGADFTIEANKLVGGAMSVDVASTVKVAGIDVNGETEVTINDLDSSVSTTDVTKLTLSSIDNDVSVSGDADLATVTMIGMNDSGSTITLANNDSTVSVGGADGTNDALTLKAVGKTTLDTNDGTNAVKDITLEGNGGALVVTFNDTDATEFTTTGSQDITLKGKSDTFDGSKFTDSSTGATNLTIATDGNDLDLTSWAAIDTLSLATDMAGDTITYAAGDLTVTVDATQSGVVTFATNDTTASSSKTLGITLNNDVGDLATSGTEATDFDTVNIGTGSLARTIADISMNTNDTVVSVVGSNDITITNSIDAGGVTVSTTKDFTAGANVTASSELVSLTGDAVNVTGNVTATNDSITITATNEVIIGGKVEVSSPDGDLIDIDGSTVAVTGNVVGGVVNLTATNDSASSSAADVQANDGAVTIDNGNWTIANVDAKDGALTISGDSTVTVTGVTNATAGITITSSNDVDLSTLGNDATVINAGSATGDITLDYNDAADGRTYATAEINVTTGSGNDVMTANDDSSEFIVSTGGGNDTINVEDALATSVFNAGSGDDILVANDISNDYTLAGGEGNDTFTVVSTGNAKVYGNDGADTFTIGSDSDATVDGGNDSDTVNLAAGTYNDNTLTLTNIEKVGIAGNTTINHLTFANDNTFELVADGVGNQDLTVTVDTNVAGTIDASGVTTEGFTKGGMVLAGNGSDDTLTAWDYGNTIVNGGAGNDNITGGAQIGDGSEVLNGDAGNDVISGGAGNDVITGGTGKDTLTGGAGNDTFAFAGNDSGGTNDITNDVDVIVDYKKGEDTIDLTAAGDAGANLTAGVNGGNDANDVTISLDNTAADFDAVVLLAEAAFNDADGVAANGNDVYVSVDAFDSGDTYIFVDSNNDGNWTDGQDMVIKLTGIDALNEIQAGDIFGAP